MVGRGTALALCVREGMGELCSWGAPSLPAAVPAHRAAADPCCRPLPPLSLCFLCRLSAAWALPR